MASNPEEPAAAAISPLQKLTVQNAVTSLLKHKIAAQSATGKLQLLPDDDYIYLNITLKKIPSNPRTNPFKIPLHHPILDAVSQVCLIVDDRPKSPTPPSDEIKKLVKSLDIPISKVLKISKLRTNYKPFEAKRKLCDSYDLFLVDKRVVHLLPKLLGKEFFKKKKLPLGVDLSKKNLNLKVQVERALGSALLYMRAGTCCVMKVAKMAMEKDEIVENVFDAVNGAVERVGKKWNGVRSLFLKFSDTLALPLYQAMPDVKLKIEGLKEMEKKAELALAKSRDNEGEVKDGSRRKDSKASKKKNKKGRIHEVHYMDGENIEIDGQKAMEESDDDKMIEDEDLSVKGSVIKKGKKGKGGLKEGAFEVSNGLKMKAKGKKDGFPVVDDADKMIEDEDLSVKGSVGKKAKKGTTADVSNGLKRKAKGKKGGLPIVDDDDKMMEDEDLSGNVSVGKKAKKNQALKEGALGLSSDLKRKAKGKKDESPSEDVPAETKGKKKTKSELVELSSERIANVKDVKKKKKNQK